MDQATSVEQMIRTWTDAYRTTWESWFNAMEQMRAASQPKESWERAVEVWHNSVQKTLETQVTWINFWAERMTVQGSSSSEASAWAQRLQEMAQTWADSQAQLAESWFDTLKKANPTTIMMTWNSEEAERVMHIWQEASQKFLEAQFGWLRLWTAAQAQEHHEAAVEMPRVQREVEA